MPITSEDIVYTFSGGNENNNPLLSLGGERSLLPVIGTTIFSDIKEADATAGYIDYRCIYINNYNSNSTLYDSKIYFNSQVASGATMYLGFEYLNERQDLKITKYDTITSGTFEMNYTYIDNTGNVAVQTFSIDYDTTFTNMANSIQSSLNGIVNLQDVTVVVNDATVLKEVSFQIEFKGASGYRYHDLISVSNISFYGLTGSIDVTRVVAGSPINRIADELDNVLINPIGITFQNYTKDSVASVGDLRPLDFIPVWLKRDCPAGALPIEGDGGTIRIYGGVI